MPRFLLGLAAFATAFFISAPSAAQQSGPLIKNYGKVYKIANPEIPLYPEQEFKAVFDVYDNPAAGEGPNPQLETAARFLNMHAQAGVPPENLKVALVVHGKAVEDLLSENAYRARNKNDNRSARLVRDLLQAGVQVAVCGQSATSQKIQRDQLIPGVVWALSAMTALVHYQDLGYRFIKF